MDAQRRQVARAIADHVGARWHDTHAEVTTLSLRQCVDALLFDTNRFTFDVRRAREWATREAALADEPIDAHEAVIHDWREAKCSDAHPSTVPGLPPCRAARPRHA